MGFKIPPGSFPEEIFLQKYAYPGETTWKETAKRVSRTAARIFAQEEESFLVQEELNKTSLIVMF